MFNARQIRGLLNATPFVPFRIRTSDGQAYDVPNHDAAMVKQNAVEIGLDLNRDGIAARSVHCAYLHIASIEDLQAA